MSEFPAGSIGELTLCFIIVFLITMILLGGGSAVIELINILFWSR